MRATLVRRAITLAAAAGLAAAPAAHATSHAAPVVDVDTRCFAPAGHPDPMANADGVPTNPEWILRDQVNQYCATLRLRDQAASPAFGAGNLTVGGKLYADQAVQQAQDLPGGHVHGGVTTLVPGSQAADPFRDLAAWEKQTRGTAKPVVFTSSDGAQLRGHVFLPPPSAPKPKGGYPGIVITDGSVQAYENLYYWAAEGLAQYGYIVMTYDVQGQGDSDLLPASCTPTSCPGVPYQQNYNFYQGAEDSLSWFASKANPAFASLDTSKLGVAGHSLGAAAVSWVGQCDSRVKTIVAWDDLQPIDITKCAANVAVPKAYRATKLHAPALATTNDYEFNVQPATHVPNPHGDTNAGGGAGDKGYQSLAAAGIDSQIVSFRNGTHLTYSYIPLVLPANELGERFAFYYTLAWFDQYLRGGSNPFTAQPAFSRLTNLGSYDASADSNRLGPVSIGAGTFDPTAVADAHQGNVPYLIKGIAIPNSLSFYFFSAYRLTDPKTHKVGRCTDMLASCPRVTPAVP